jgi:hypothetical protein
MTLSLTSSSIFILPEEEIALRMVKLKKYGVSCQEFLWLIGEPVTESFSHRPVYIGETSEENCQRSADIV